MKIPRGVYYLSFLRIVLSTIKLPFCLLDKQGTIAQFKLEIEKKIEMNEVLLMPMARIAFYFYFKSLKAKPGDEILMSPMTLPDMVNMLVLAGFKPVFVDFKKNQFSIDLDEAGKKVSPRTRVLFVTHLYGIVPDMEALTEFASAKNLLLVQDCTQSYGCKYKEKNLSTYADCSVYSMCALKDLHTHMGALLYIKNLNILNDVKKSASQSLTKISRKYFWKFIKEDLIASLALNPKIFSFFTYYIFSVLFLFNRKKIEDLIDGRGLKLGPFVFFYGLFGDSGYERRKSVPKVMLYQFSSLQAEVGLSQMQSMDINMHKRIKNTKLLINHLSDEARASLPEININSVHSFWRLPIIVENVNKFEKYLFDRGIDPGKTTLPCLPSLDIFNEFRDKSYYAESIGRRSIFLPNFHYLKTKDIIRVSQVVNDYFQDYNRETN